MNGIPAFLPQNLSPSDLPILGDLLNGIDPWDHTAHLTNETVSLTIVTHHPNSSITEMNIAKFNIFNVE